MPVTTDRLSDTDIFIKNLAMELDGRLGAGYVFATYAGSLTPDSSGYCNVPFALSRVVGAIIQPTGIYATAIPAYCDPVPPATIGRYIGSTGYAGFINTMDYQPGVVRVAFRSTTFQTVTGSANTPVGYGSRPVSSGGGALPLVGIAWGVE